MTETPELNGGTTFAPLTTPPMIQLCGKLWHKAQGVFGNAVVPSGDVSTTGGGCTGGGGSEEKALEPLANSK